jgi:hypothetical protein
LKGDFSMVKGTNIGKGKVLELHEANWGLRVFR